MQQGSSHGRIVSLLLVSALLACCCPPAAGHAALVFPQSRNWVAYLQQDFYWAHGLSAGGSRGTAGNGTLTWPEISLGSLCGDADGESSWDTPGGLQATYMQGQDIEIDVLVAVNHLGRFDFKLCELDAKPVPGDKHKCHQLERADGKGVSWYLPFIKEWTGGNSGHDEPAYGDGSFSWYTLPSLGSKAGCSRQTCNEFAGMVVYRTQWRLPAGVTCKHCKLMWTYMTAHSCWPPCPAANADEPTCKNVQVFPECGQPGPGAVTAYPEHSLNCADVRIVTDPSEVPSGLVNKPTWESDATIHTGAFGTPAAYRMFGTQPLPHKAHKASTASPAAVATEQGRAANTVPAAKPSPTRRLAGATIAGSAASRPAAEACNSAAGADGGASSCGTAKAVFEA